MRNHGRPGIFRRVVERRFHELEVLGTIVGQDIKTIRASIDEVLMIVFACQEQGRIVIRIVSGQVTDLGRQRL